MIHLTLTVSLNLQKEKLNKKKNYPPLPRTLTCPKETSENGSNILSQISNPPKKRKGAKKKSVSFTVLYSFTVNLKTVRAPGSRPVLPYHKGREYLHGSQTLLLPDYSPYLKPILPQPRLPTPPHPMKSHLHPSFFLCVFLFF